MNSTTRNILPYIIIPDFKYAKILIDCGSTSSFLNPELAKQLFPKFIRSLKMEISTPHGSRISDECVYAPIPGIFKQKGYFRLLMYKFHDFFDVLIGIDILKELKMNVDFKKQSLEAEKISIPLLFHDTNPKITKIISPPFSEKIIKVPVNTTETEVFIPQVKLGKNLEIPSCLTNVENGLATCSIFNHSDTTYKMTPTGFIPCEPANVYLIQVTDKNQLNVLKKFEGKKGKTSIHNFETSKKRFDLSMLRADHLNAEEYQVIKDVALEYNDVFFIEGQPLTFANDVKHKIITTCDNPINVRPYQYPFALKEEIRRQLDQMLETGVIRPSYSPWNSPLWIVPKKADSSGKRKYRIVIDFRALNKVTVGDSYPIPVLNHTLSMLGRCQYFSALDLFSGFNQILLDEESIPKTAFSFENCKFEYLRLPFGLKNAPSAFQRTMDNVLRGYQNDFCTLKKNLS